MKSIALDTNILLLYVIGSATRQVAGKRLKAFTPQDLGILGDFLSRYDRLVTTPNVWSEVSNVWSWGIDGVHRYDVVSRIAETIRECIELVRPSKDIIDDPEFARLGLTDCVWLSVLDNRTTLLTDDLALCNVAISRGHRAINFTHLRNFD